MRWDNAPVLAIVNIYNSLGMFLGSASFSDVKVARIFLLSFGITDNQLFFVKVNAGGMKYEMKKVMVKD